MMKTKMIIGASLLTVALVMSFQSSAVSTDLNITGAIFSGSCDLTVANNGSFDYGDIENSMLTSTGTQLSTLQGELDVSCAAPTYVAIHWIDNRDGSEYLATSIPGGLGTNVSSNKIGLGYDNAGNPIGYAGIALPEQPLVNGVQGQYLNSLDMGNSWTALGTGTIFGLGRLYSATDNPSVTTAPSPISSLNLKIVLTSWLAPKNALDASKEINLDGSVTAELFYL